MERSALTVETKARHTVVGIVGYLLRGLTVDAFIYRFIHYLWKLKLTNLAASCPQGKGRLWGGQRTEIGKSLLYFLLYLLNFDFRNDFRKVVRSKRQSLAPPCQQKILQTYPKTIPLPPALNVISKQIARPPRQCCSGPHSSGPNLTHKKQCSFL